MEVMCVLSSVVFLVLIQLVVCKNETINCQVNTFQTKQNFNLKQYLGTWYEMKWLVPFDVPVADRYLDYRHNYTMNTDNQVLVSITARNSSKHCLYFNAYLNLTATPGKMVLSLQPDGGGDTYTYWVIDTDYVNYALTYACGEMLPNGTCGKVRSWIWSRKTSISQTLLNSTEVLLNGLCVDASSLITTSHVEDACSKQNDDAVITTSSCWCLIIPIVVYLSIFHLI
ncbi:hypothetical protein SNE40_017971 [Patella caerulea]|uniref:Lipocalin/cytosolic fatty-acid binding domain-containing protein n=1 Tax=Patella caerulea TaxID=87958 RepID=A0AAN8JBF6_PATCE